MKTKSQNPCGGIVLKVIITVATAIAGALGLGACK
ncbi:smalltalk protein [Bacteroides uniformis]